MSWKITAIIFIVLFCLETFTFVVLLMIGTKVIGNENKCAINICENGGYDGYRFDQYENICYCYLNNKVKYQEAL
jgi:hypothetical protein